MAFHACLMLFKDFDEVKQEWLLEQEVIRARKKEMEYFKNMAAYTKVRMDDCKRVTGKQPIKLRWIDTRMPTAEVRSRLVARDYKKHVRPNLFSATPPLEATRLLLSMAALAQLRPRDWGM